jgi:hypothetical protein
MRVPFFGCNLDVLARRIVPGCLAHAESELGVKDLSSFHDCGTWMILDALESQSILPGGVNSMAEAKLHQPRH